jgi:hypothetical protein
MSYYKRLDMPPIVSAHAVEVGAAGNQPGGDLVEQLSKLAQLHQNGVLTDAEHSAAKQKLLAPSTGGDLYCRPKATMSTAPPLTHDYSQPGMPQTIMMDKPSQNVLCCGLFQEGSEYASAAGEWLSFSLSKEQAMDYFLTPRLPAPIGRHCYTFFGILYHADKPEEKTLSQGAVHKQRFHPMCYPNSNEMRLGFEHRPTMGEVRVLCVDRKEGLIRMESEMPPSNLIHRHTFRVLEVDANNCKLYIQVEAFLSKPRVSFCLCATDYSFQAARNLKTLEDVYSGIFRSIEYCGY